MNELPLSDAHRSRLLDFVETANRTFGDGGFNRADKIDDVRLTILAIMGAQLLGVSDDNLAAFFADEFGLAEIDEKALAELLSSLTLTGVEDRVRCASGGRN